MKCAECGSHKSSFNDMLGETCCDDCGLVISFIPFEETSYLKKLSDVHIGDSHGQHAQNATKGRFFATNDGLGSNIPIVDKKSRKLARTQLRQSSRYRGGLTQADKEFQVIVRNIIYQYGLVGETKHDIADRCMKLRRRLQEKHVARGHSAEFMANCITYLIFKEIKIPVSLRRHVSVTGESRKRLSKVTRRWAKHMTNPQIHQQQDVTLMVSNALNLLQTNIGETLDSEFREKTHILGIYLEKQYTALDMSYRNSTNAMCIWMASLMEGYSYRQSDIASVCETTAQTIRLQLRQFYSLFEMDKRMLQQTTVEEFVSGIRNKNR